MRTTAMESVYFALMLTFVVTKCQSQLLHLPGYHYNPQVIKLPVLLVVCACMCVGVLCVHVNLFATLHSQSLCYCCCRSGRERE